MRTLLIQAIACCATLLPTTQVQAASAGEGSANFAGKKTFTLNVDSFSSSAVVGKKVIKKAPITKPIPDYSKNKTVKFTIAANGNLTGPGFSVPLLTSEATVNSYATTDNNPLALHIIGHVYKDGNTITGADLHFESASLDKTTLTTHFVNYFFKMK